MPVVDIFKPIVDGSVVEGWVMQTLKDWWQVYAREVAIQRGEDPDRYPLPKSYITVDGTTPDREVADQLPALVVVSPGLDGTPPRHDGRGQYRASWMVGIGLFVSGNTREATKDLVRIYTAIARAIMLQKSSLGGHASRATWTDESYDDDFNFTDQQTISAGSVIFSVEVDNVITHGAGPVGPPNPGTQPGSLPHHADHIIIDLEKESLDE